MCAGGLPLPNSTHPEDTLTAAFEMLTWMEKFNEEQVKNGKSKLGIRIGVNTGPVVAGALGSSQRLKYTTVGDTVNTAARLESYDKDFARESLCRILVGESTLRYLGNQFKTRLVGEVVLKGKDQKITIYQIFGGKG